MGLFDGLKRDKKAAETVKQHKKEEIVEDELIIDYIEVVERETVKKFLLLLSRRSKIKRLSKMWSVRQR